jgi:hypothetical protein
MFRRTGRSFFLSGSDNQSNLATVLKMFTIAVSAKSLARHLLCIPRTLHDAFLLISISAKAVLK